MKTTNMTPLPTTSCIDWTGYFASNGYGRRGKVWAHRWMYEQAYGPIPSGMVVMHLCDRPSCVRIEHLALGTHQENAQMAWERGLTSLPMLKGEELPQTKIAEDDVRTIRARRAAGETYRAIAEDYPITLSCVQYICYRRLWKHVT